MYILSKSLKCSFTSICVQIILHIRHNLKQFSQNWYNTQCVFQNFLSRYQIYKLRWPHYFRESRTPSQIQIYITGMKCTKHVPGGDWSMPVDVGQFVHLRAFACHVSNISLIYNYFNLVNILDNPIAQRQGMNHCVIEQPKSTYECLKYCFCFCVPPPFSNKVGETCWELYTTKEERPFPTSFLTSLLTAVTFDKRTNWAFAVGQYRNNNEKNLPPTFNTSPS